MSGSLRITQSRRGPCGGLETHPVILRKRPRRADAGSHPEILRLRLRLRAEWRL